MRIAANPKGYLIAFIFCATLVAHAKGINKKKDMVYVLGTTTFKYLNYTKYAYDMYYEETRVAFERGVLPPATLSGPGYVTHEVKLSKFANAGTSDNLKQAYNGFYFQVRVRFSSFGQFDPNQNVISTLFLEKTKFPSIGYGSIIQKEKVTTNRGGYYYDVSCEPSDAAALYSPPIETVEQVPQLDLNEVKVEENKTRIDVTLTCSIRQKVTEREVLVINVMPDFTALFLMTR